MSWCNKSSCRLRAFLSSLQIVAVIRTLQTLPDFRGVTLDMRSLVLLPPLGTLPFLEALEIKVNDNDIAIPTGPD
ncbi:hypothetical protein RchiOBHm_Chr2g0131581 [Rosa chinensis]|uniref:Uncharacterized protein n=1 Tax=Rosa chinensis TaxID=74649 RepID=A0A2P6RV35_ROSCH|nr:hypothetical protein RchiOBHm_Chr2g0131581 [Rosa chinensis]